MPPRPSLPSTRTLLNTALALAALAALIILLTRSAPSPGIEIERRHPPGGVDAVRVHVAGAVLAPGLVEVDPGDRVGDAIAAAGGASPDGDPDALNLARRVLDGERIEVPRIGGRATNAPALIDLNRATQRELESLPGIGPARADAIVAAREFRPFESSDDLLERSVIPLSVYEAIRDLVTTSSARR
ncbi:MAG: helix-hairpin-helix domain-containing protein [Acidobacteria bacterium]|nr:helix-hairpin-helix domain-containing protein [Acidobacteriota bacterium]MQC25448.1 competence protein ComEA [Chloroflexota bacterium]MQC48563.1 competence protein ComEA [Chloroflexota bacterium]